MDNGQQTGGDAGGNGFEDRGPMKGICFSFGSEELAEAQARQAATRPQAFVGYRPRTRDWGGNPGRPKGAR